MLTQKQILLVEEFQEELNLILDKYSKLEILSNLSITKISKEMKLSRQTIYKYFDWMNELATQRKNLKFKKK